MIELDLVESLVDDIETENRVRATRTAKRIMRRLDGRIDNCLESEKQFLFLFDIDLDVLDDHTFFNILMSLCERFMSRRKTEVYVKTKNKSHKILNLF